LPIYTGSSFSMAAALPLDDRERFADLTARDALSALRRYEGLVCYVVSEQKLYHLKGGITNAHWEELGTGGTGSPEIDDALASTIFTNNPPTGGTEYACHEGLTTIERTSLALPFANTSSQALLVSPCGRVLAAGFNTSPFVAFYRIDYASKTLYRMANPSTLPTAYCARVSSSSDGTLICFYMNASPYFRVFKINYTTGSINTGTISTPPTAAGLVHITPDGRFVYYSDTSGIRTYSIDVATGNATFISANTSFGTATRNIEITPDGKYLIGNLSSGTFETVILAIDQTTGALSAVPSSPLLPTGISIWAKISPDGTKYAVGSSTSDVLVYSIDSTTGALTLIPNSAPLATTFKQDLTWSGDSKYLYTCMSSSPWYRVFMVSGSSVDPVTSPIVLATASTLSLAMTPNGRFLFAGLASSTTVRMFEVTGRPPITELLD